MTAEPPPLLDSSTSYWLKFLTDAGIPNTIAATYAIIFSEHRIQSSMLADLNKEYLVDMGVKCMGDIITILKHVKSQQTQQPTTSQSGNKVDASQAATSSSGRRSTAASRMVSAHIGNDPTARPMSEPGVSDILKSSPVTVQDTRGSVFERLGHVATRSATATRHSVKGSLSVKDRLGVSTDTSGEQDQGLRSKKSWVLPAGKLAATELHKIVQLAAGSQKKKNRLSVTIKRPATTTCPDTDDSDGSPGSPLPYLGVLKTSASTPRKRRKSSSASDISPPVKRQLVNENTPNLSVKKPSKVKPQQVKPASTEGILSPEASAAGRQTARQRLGTQK